MKENRKISPRSLPSWFQIGELRSIFLQIYLYLEAFSSFLFETKAKFKE